MDAKSNVTHKKFDNHKFDTDLLTQEKREDERPTTTQKGKTN